MLLSLHEAYITNYNANGVIYHPMDLLLLFFSPSPTLPTRELVDSVEYRFQVLGSPSLIKMDGMSSRTKL